MSLPRISIVTPSYNSEEFIEETILSVLDQSYPNIQYIVIDGGSTDKTPEIIRKYERHLAAWISEPDSGQSEAIRKGISLCDGNIFNWLNSDDTLTNNALLHVGQLFSDPKTQVVAGRSRKYGMGFDYISSGTDIYDTLERTVGRARIDQPETFFRLESVRFLGGPSLKYHFIMDREFWIRYLLCFGLSGIIKIDNILVNFRHHDNSKTINQSSGFAEEDLIISRWFLELNNSEITSMRSLLSPNHINLSKAKSEWCLHHFQIAYALRNWLDMDNWDIQSQRYESSLSADLCRIHLRLRRFFLSNIRKFDV
jgi:glycosyltransferase involved in cell wall biosynthesis